MSIFENLLKMVSRIQTIMSKNRTEEADVLMTLLPDKQEDHVVLSMDEDENNGPNEGDSSQKEYDRPQGEAKVTQSQRRNKPSRKTQIHTAAELGDAETLQALVTDNKEVGLQDASFQTPLHLAAKGLHHQCCLILLRVSTKEINLKDKAGDTSLMLSISSGNMSFNTTKLLISKGATVSIDNRGKKTALHIAAEKGNAETLKLLIERDKSCIDKKATEKLTPLHLAAKNGHRETCQVFLSAGANTEAEDNKGYTPLHWAAKMGFLGCIKCLIGSKCDVNSTDKAGNTPLHLLCSSGKDKGDCVEELLNQGADINAQNDKGETPFHLAQYSSYDVRKAFQNKPVNLLLTDKKRQTVLHCAANRSKSSNRIDLILSMDQLRKMNVEQFINVLNIDDYSALHMAVINGELSSCRSLVKTGADGNIICDTKGNALHLAAEEGFAEICDFLITKGVKLNVKNKQSFTPLHLAARNGHVNCCKVLIKRGAQISETDAGGNTALHHAAGGNTALHHAAGGNTALHHAAEGSHIECCKLFMGTKSTLVNKFNSNGKTPLHLAVEMKSVECCEVLVTNKSDLWACETINIPSPIKLAYELELFDILHYLLQQCDPTSKIQSKIDVDFRKLIEDGLKNSNKKLVESVISSCYWEKSLQPYDEVDHDKRAKKENKNLRYLVKKYPSLAEDVLDKCLPSQGDSHEKDSVGRYKLFYIDDMSVESSNKEREATRKKCHTTTLSYEDLFDPNCGALLREFKTIGINQKWRKTHVLSCLIDQGQSNLLKHPLIITWITHKWYRYIQLIHYLFLLFALTVATLLTTYSLEAWSWQAFEEKFETGKNIICNTEEQLVGPEVFPFLKEEAFAANIISNVTIGILALWFLHDIYKLFRLRSRYFCAESSAFLVCATTSVVFLGNFTHCTRLTYIREDWQWIAGYVAIFSAWILSYYLYSTHPTRPPLLDLSGFSLAAKKVLMPEVPIIILVIAIYAMIPKGYSALRHVFESIQNLYGDLSSFGALILIILSVVVVVRMFRNRNYKIDPKTDGPRIVAAVNMILDYDLVYPWFRRMFYKAWLTVEEEQRSNGCLGFLRCCRSKRIVSQVDTSQLKGSKMKTSEEKIEGMFTSVQAELKEIREIVLKL